MRAARLIALASTLAAPLPVPATAAQGPTHARYSDYDRCWDKDATPDERLEACDRILKGHLFRTRSDAVQILFQMANNYMMKGDYDHAFPCFNDVIRLEPKMWQAYANRGTAFLQFKEYARALKDFDMLVELKPDYARGWHVRGVAKKALGDVTGADADFAKASELEAASPSPAGQ